MIVFDVPGVGGFRIEVLLSDLNGTLSINGEIDEAVRRRLADLSTRVEIMIVTSDTRNCAHSLLQGLPVSLRVTSGSDCLNEKLALLDSLGPGRVCAFGNGANDVAMLEKAAVSVCVLGSEGAAARALVAADMVVAGPVDALDALLDPTRIISALRR